MEPETVPYSADGGDEDAAIPASFAPGARPVAIIPGAGREPSPTLTEREATAAWVAATAPWHPAILARSEALPRIEEVDTPSPATRGELRLLAHEAGDRLPSGYRTSAEDAGSPVIDASIDRPEAVAKLRDRLGATDGPTGSEADGLAADFLALGAASWWIDGLTLAMGHLDGLDRDAFRRETLVGARAWAEGDFAATKARLRAAFEVVTQARERFYPVDSYLIDLTLLDPRSRASEVDEALRERHPFTLLAPAKAIEALAIQDPDRMAALRAAIDDGWADIIGGPYGEADEPISPLTSTLWELRKGAEVYRAHLDGRTVETFARRKFGLYPQLPQVARRFGFRFALHLGLDAGTFPIRPELKRLWEAPDGSTIEALNRPPIAVDRAVEGVRLPWRLAKSLKDDFTGAIVAVHWAGRVSPWYTDLRRALSYSPSLLRSSTVNDFFHLTDRPYESFRVGPDEYTSPALVSAIGRGDMAPISGRADHARLRARVDAVEAASALASALGRTTPVVDPDAASIPSIAEVEGAIETGRRDEARRELPALERGWAGALAAGIAGSDRSTGGRPGYLVLNPTGVARRVPVSLPEAALDLRAESPLRATQQLDRGVIGVVDVAAFGYAWVPRAPIAGATTIPGEEMTLRDRTLKSDALSAAIDPATGGLRGIHGPGEPTARLGQQLVIVGLVGADGKPATSRMKGAGTEVEHSGPGLLQASTTGSLHHPADDRLLARFHQRFRLWSGRPTLEIEVTLTDLDPTWLADLARLDPWSHYLACRWAWPDPESTLRRLVALTPEPTDVDRPETAEAIDLTSRRRRTTLLFGGLAHHRRVRPRMLDTILVAGLESGRTFTLGVAVDLEHPFAAAVDSIAPAFVVATEAGPPTTGPAGWLLAVDTKAVAVAAVTPFDYDQPSEPDAPGSRLHDGEGRGILVTLIETSGRATRCRVRTFRDPLSARQVDFQGEMVLDLTTDGDATLVDLTPHEIARIEIRIS